MKKYCKNDWILVLLLFVVILMVYYPALNNDFIMEWDDQWQVMTSTTENGLTWENINHMFSYSFQNQYFPVNQLCYSLVYLFVDGYKAWGFHLFCVLLHLSNTLLVFILFKRLLRISGRMDKESIRPVSFITALLFAIHPLNVESVAWISASKILVYSFFYLIALYTYLIYVKIQKKTISFSYYVFVCSFIWRKRASRYFSSLFIADGLVYWCRNE